MINYILLTIYVKKITFTFCWFLQNCLISSLRYTQLYYLGQALAEMGMGFKALQQYDYALELNPKSPIVFH